MVFTFARISAICGMNVADIFHQQRRLWVRLHEKGGKFHEMPCHHTLEGYLAEYIECARLVEAARVPLFQAIKHRPYGRGQANRRCNGKTASTLGRWCAVAPRLPASPRRFATTRSAAPGSPHTSRTAALWKKRAKWPPIHPPAPLSSMTGARIASRWRVRLPLRGGNG